MKILDRLRRDPAGNADDSGTAPARREDAGGLPIPDYDKLDPHALGARLPRLSQAELAAIESYERSHGNRAAVLDKLRYMRSTEPLPNYDSLSAGEIVEALASADRATVKAVRDYERKFGNRPQVMREAARVLPTSELSAGQDQAGEERDARIRAGIAGREKTAEGLADRGSGSKGDAKE